MQIAAIQMVSTPSVEHNIERARTLVAQAAAQGAELVALPEYFCLMGRADRDKLGAAERLLQGPIQATLASMAREHGIWLVGGTLPLIPEDGPFERVRNSSLVFGPDGELAARYDKMHLFRFHDGERGYDEAATLEPGTAPAAFELRDRAGETWRVGLSVCYDLRFPELYRALMQPRPCDLLLVPSAFTYPTGQAHWELLLRARAVENQCYVLAPAQGGRHENGRRTWGHTLLADPWGEVLAQRADEGEGVVGGAIERARLEAVRGQLPALAHRVL
ncbi:carbon-nitrogen hydrolase family protein [Rivibacter subsaxonicus]|uniref:Nitrilase n=1 Tax=Rivibacter subsaxonicus TaxID=457575 RepID=A0A4Q7VW23_9BURK|nr:carbon-nitrogen hydrolase family protein [Rivibacter subsaxonicus]RZU00638.1 nitrilase [Rivibacter subsaxonicus]